jgi:hypothetical protein
MKKLVPAQADETTRTSAINGMMSQSDEWWRNWIKDGPVTPEAKQREIDRILADCGEMFINDVYCVHVRHCGTGDNGELIHLSIKRHDRQPITDWRDKQDIKNQLCGAESEGVELYPAESRVVDTANQFHLWVFVGGKIDLGFPHGAKTNDTIGLSQQRPRTEERTPEQQAVHDYWYETDHKE